MYTSSKIGRPRLPKIICDPKAEPFIPSVIPIFKSTWWSGVKSERFPSFVLLSSIEESAHA